MIRYNELLKRKLEELRTDVKTFFRIAHIHQFGTDPDLTADLELFEEKKTVPIYVQRYLEPACR